jgi:hypothetical protein
MTNTESASVSPQSSHNTHASPATATGGASHKAGDQPFFDPVAYGNGPDDSVTDATETAAITHHSTTIGGQKINYTATAGHLVIVDASSSQPEAKMFYVAFTQDNQKEETRPVTFFYNGGPGSSSVFVLLGSFAPRRIKTSMPGFYQSGGHRLLGGHCAEDEPSLLGRRSGRRLDQAVHQALSNQEQSLEFAEVSVRRVLRHGAQLRAGVPAA